MTVRLLKYFALIVCLTGCKKCRDCKQPGIRGDIISTYELPNCFFGENRGEYYIRDTSNFINLLKTIPHSSDCDTNYMNMVDINFSKHILLGKYLDGGGCGSKFIREVIIDNNKKTVKYRVVICTNGTCLKLMFSNNFVLVPKFPQDYKVSFETKEY